MYFGIQIFFFHMEQSFKFGKEYKLTSPIRIKEVFETGIKSFFFPFKVYYLSSPHVEGAIYTPFKVCIVAPKKRFKHATDRNTIKRRAKEALRLNKYIFDHEHPTNILDIYLVYISNEIEHISKIDQAIKKILHFCKDGS
jgi:ribonuclease P protein component